MINKDLASAIVRLANAADAAGRYEVADIYDRELIALQRGRLILKKEAEFTQDEILDYIENALSVAGFVPGIGDAADAIGAGVAMYRGDIIGACLSLVSMLPGAGDAMAKPVKFALKMGKKLPLDKVKPIIDLVARNKSNIINKVRNAAKKIPRIDEARAEKLAAAVTKAFEHLEKKLKEMILIEPTVVGAAAAARAIPGVEQKEKQLANAMPGRPAAV